ncbi:MAG TPA: LysR family transcriptional regulator [Polyangiaceae bacterium]
MDLLLIRSLLAVAEHGAVTDAAAALGVSQSALSRRIDQLEADLHVPLLERIGRGVTLTEMGRLVVEEGKLIVQRYELLQARLQEHLALDAGIVRIGGGATAVAFMLPGAIAEFRKKYPGVVFQVKEAGSRDIETAVIEEQLELGVVTLPVQRKDFDVRDLAQDRITLVASRHHPLSKQKSVQAQDLQGEKLVGFEAGTAVRWLIDAALRKVGVQVQVAMELRSVAAILQMVEATRSLGFVSELAVQPGVGQPRRGVVPVHVRGLEIRRQLALISKQGRSLSPAAKEFTRVLATSP